MKATKNILQITVIVFLSMMTITAMGQPNSRGDRRSGGNSNNARTENTQRGRSDAKAVQPQRAQGNNNNKSYQRGQDDNRGAYQKPQNDNRAYSQKPQGGKNNAHYNQHNGNHSVKRGPNYYKPRNTANHRPPVVNYKHKGSKHHHTYYRHLPSQRVNRFNYNGHHYYHSNKRFYQYHPGHGYIVVDAPFVRVNVLPAHYQVRIYNGNPYPYFNGFFFLPIDFGYAMIPAPAQPHLSFNVMLNL
ncbi:MAG: hypothetical protein GXY94_04760 [Bacteroidales bacterium]|nr:hypothetical protein [Bacteroidales bacterium]